MTPQQVLQELINRAEERRVIGMDYSPDAERQRMYNTQKVGQLVLSSGDECRRLLEQLTSADVTNVRFPLRDPQHYIVDEKTKKVSIDPTYRPRKRVSVVRLPHEKK